MVNESEHWNCPTTAAKPIASTRSAQVSTVATIDTARAAAVHEEYATICFLYFAGLSGGGKR
jgi:hypothetical protein